MRSFWVAAGKKLQGKVDAADDRQQGLSAVLLKLKEDAATSNPLHFYAILSLRNFWLPLPQWDTMLKNICFAVEKEQVGLANVLEVRFACYEVRLLLPNRFALIKGP